MNPLIQLKRTIALCAPTLGFFASIIFVSATTLPAAEPPWGLSFDKWSVQEFQPQIKPGGRANTIAVHPNDMLILVASESGGLFRSENGGKSWTHVDSLPVFYTNAVAFTKVDPKFVLVTASEDSSVSNHGGIWRSEDGGKTWIQALWLNPATGKIDLPNPPRPSWTTERFRAYEISVASDTGKIYVGSNYGVLVGDPSGKNWSEANDAFADLVGSYDRRVISVVALPTTYQGCDGNPGGGNLVLAGGRCGIRRSLDGGYHWCKPKQSTDCDPNLAKQNDAGCVTDMHAFGRSPSGQYQAYAAAPSYQDDKVFMQLYKTTDGGDTWNVIRTADGTTGSGGIAFVKARTSPMASNSVDLYFSNRLFIDRQSSGGAWEHFIKYRTTSEAGDTRDIAFNSQNQPILAATDGGLIQHNGMPKPPSVADIQLKLKDVGYYAGAITGYVDDFTQKALTKYQSDHELTPTGTVDQPTIDSLETLWEFAGADNKGNGPNGFNALQVYEVQGQWIAKSTHYLYFGTQDNSLWSSCSTATVNAWTACCNEGGFIETEYHVAAESDSQITFSTGFDPNGNHILQQLLFPGALGSWTGFDPWVNPPGPASGWPKIIRKNFHVQGSELALDPVANKVVLIRGLAFTTDLGATWEQFAGIGFNRMDLPRLSGAEEETPVLYQAIAMDINKDALARIVKKKNAKDASVSYPNMMTGFPEFAFGIGPVMGAHYRVFAVDPKDANHLIAADSRNSKMMETINGGDNWTVMPLLTDQVMDGGRLNFSGGVFLNGYWSHNSVQASAISFYPDDPNMVAVGTLQNGIFISTNRGKDGTWTKVPGSEKATLISSLHWRKADDLIVSTYGRGLWRVQFNYTLPIPPPCQSPDCYHVYVTRPPAERPSPYDEVVLAYGGSIEGARVKDRILEEIFVEPSTTIAFAVDSRQLPDVKVTETTTPMRFQGVTRMPRPPKRARIVTGLTLKKRGERSELVGFLFSPRQQSMYTPEKSAIAEEKPVGRRESPTAGKPYLEVLTGSVTLPFGTIQLAGRNLGAGRPVEIAFDGYTVQRLVADRSGKFSATVKAPSGFGVHSLTLIDSASGKVLNGAMVSVRPQDSPRSR